MEEKVVDNFGKLYLVKFRSTKDSLFCRYSGTSVKIPIVKIRFTPKLANYLLF